MKKIILLIFAFYNYGFGQYIGPNEDQVVIKDFKYNWEVFDASESLFLPFTVKADNKNKVFGLRVNVAAFPNANFLLKTGKNKSFLFINEVLKAELKPNQWHQYALSTLKSQNNNKDSLRMFFYTLDNPEDYLASITFTKNKNESQLNTKNATEILNYLPRDNKSFTSILSFSFLFLLSLSSFLGGGFGKTFIKYLNPAYIFERISSANLHLISKPLDRPNVLFIILLSIVYSVIVLLFSGQHVLRIYSNYNLFNNWDGFGQYLIDYVLLFILILASLVIKYLFIRVIGRLFSLEKFVDIHFYKLIQISIIFGLALIIISLLNFNSNILNISLVSQESIKYCLIGFYVFRTLSIFNTLYQLDNTKILYIISYLCIVELFLILFGFRLLF